jgi:outer membrane cobalamin receptor
MAVSLKHRVFVGVVLCAWLVLGAPVPAPAQGRNTAEVSGVIKDASGGVLPGALVEGVIGGRAISSVTTGADGRYRLNMPAGVPFEIQVHLEGFAAQSLNVAGTSTPVSRDIELGIGNISDTLVVTAARGAEGRAQVTSSVSVLAADDIQAVGASQLSEILRQVPGVNIEGTGREGGLMSMFSRGGESDYNLVLVDGVRMNANGGGFDFGRINADEIERVEVVRGAQSSLWGSDAMGAVVQVITKRAGAADRPAVSGSLEGGSFATLRSDVRLGGGARQRVDYNIGVAYRRTDGAFKDILPEPDSYEQTALNASVGASLGNRATLRSSLRYSDSQGKSVGNIDYGTRDRGTVYENKDLTWHLEQTHLVGPRYTGTATVNYFRQNALSADTIADPTFNVYTLLEGTHLAPFPDGPRLVRLLTQSEFDSLSANPSALGSNQFVASTAFGVSDFPFSTGTKFRRPAVRYQGDLTWGGAQRLSVGYEWERETNALVPSQQLDNNAFFIQQQFNLGDRWFVTAGGRVDSKESYDTFFSPKLSAGGFLMPYRPGAVSSVKVLGNIGKGIKSPLFSERLGASYADPNPDLRVERARTADVGIEVTLADQWLRSSLVYFDNDYKDQIAYRFGPVGDGIPEFINIDGSTAHGLEFELRLQKPVAGFMASGVYSLVDTEVVTNLSTSQQFLPGQPLLRRPKHAGTLRAAYVAGRATANVDARFIGQRHDNSFLSLRSVPNPNKPNAVTTDITVNPGYAVVGLGVDVRAHEKATVFFRADNIGDTQWESVLGYPGMPRAAYAGVRFDLGLGR